MKVYPILTAIPISESLSFGTKWLRLGDVDWFVVGYEHCAIDGQNKAAVVNCTFNVTADLFGKLYAFCANHNLAFFGFICFYAIKVHYKI